MFSANFFLKNVPTMSAPIINSICPMQSFFDFLIIKNSSEPFSENIFIFWYYSMMIINLKFRIFLITFLIKPMYVLNVQLIGFNLIVLWYALLYLFTILSNFSVYTVLIVKSTADFLSLYAKILYILLHCNNDFIGLL